MDPLFAVGIAVLLIVMGTPREVGMSPWTRMETGLDKTEPPPCRQATNEELYARGMGREGKAATWQFRGYEICERPIFSYEERDSFATFVANHVEGSARRAAIAVQNRASQMPSAKGVSSPVWAVEVRGDDASVIKHVESTFQFAMTDAMGSGRVQHARPSETQTPRVVVTIRRTQDPQYLFDVAIVEKREDGSLKWSAL